MKRILIIGSESKLAARFVSHCAKRADLQVMQTSYRNAQYHFLDLSAPDTMASELLDIRFDSCLVFAAIANIAQCEFQPQKAMLVNCLAIEALISRLNVGNWILFSTNQVFSGEIARVAKKAQQNPLSEYGKTKTQMELMARSSAASVAIVRLTKVIDRQFPLFNDFLTTLSARQCVTAYADMVFAPINIDSVCQFLLALVDNFRPDVYQLSATNDLSYYAALLYIASGLNLPTRLITPAPAPVNCPKNTTLMVDTMESELGFSAKTAEQTLKEIFLC